MQEIKVYVSAENSVGTLRDYANAKNQSAPPLVRDVDVLLKFRLFAAAGTIEPYPIEQLQEIKAWKFVMDRDFDNATQCIFQADNELITVSSVTDTVDGTEYEYTEIAVPISNTNTVELDNWLGKNKQQSGLTAELAGYDASGNTVFVLQLENFSVRNRLTDTGEPTELPSDYWTEAQVRAFTAAEIDRAVESQAFKMLPAISSNDTWVINGVDTGKPSNGRKGDKGDTGSPAGFGAPAASTASVSADSPAEVKVFASGPDTAKIFNFEFKIPQGRQGEKGERGSAFEIDATGTLAERSRYDAEAKDFSYLASDNGNVYIKQSDSAGDWSAPIPFKGDKGDKPFNLRGGWSSGTTYSKDDAVTYNGSLYIAAVQTSEVPGSGDGWNLYVSKGEKGEKGDTGSVENLRLEITSVANGAFLVENEKFFPVAVLTSSGKCYPLEKESLHKAETGWRIDIAKYLAYDNITEFTAPWFVYCSGGVKGEDGWNFNPDARGRASEKSNYDNEAKGFAFLAIDEGNMYFKLSESRGDWSAAVPFRGEKGATGSPGAVGAKGDKGDDGGIFPIVVVNSLPENPDQTTLYLIPME